MDKLPDPVTYAIPAYILLLIAEMVVALRRDRSRYEARDTLTSLLDELHLGKYPLLHGKQFEVTVGMGGQPGCSVALVASAAQVTAGGSHAER